MLARMPAARPIVFLSDFGLGNEWVGLCHAVMSGIAPQCPIVDLSHLVRPLEVTSGAILLADAMPYIHESSVVLAVVDPNVGKDREVAIETESGRTRCERSTIGHCGAMPLITAWHRPTHSFPRPKSLRKTIGRAAGMRASMVRRPCRCKRTARLPPRATGR